MKILVTAAGGGGAQSILKALRMSGNEVIAVDGDALGAGLYMCDRGYLVPFANKPDYVPRLLEICEKENVGVIFPGMDLELPVLSKHRAEFAAAGVTVVVSDEAFVELCDDKLLTAGFLEQHGFPFPKTWSLDEYAGEEPPFPVILKVRRGGARSQGIRVVRTAADLAAARRDLDTKAYVMQELIDGTEYSCGTITFNGVCKGAIVLRRVLRDGDTYKAWVERHPEMEAFVSKLATAMGGFGPLNVQLRVREGVPYVFEFNARCSGTTCFRALAGFNEPQMIADYILNGTEPVHSIRPVTVLRYWNELVVENEVIEACRQMQTVSGAVPPFA